MLLKNSGFFFVRRRQLKTQTLQPTYNACLWDIESHEKFLQAENALNLGVTFGEIFIQIYRSEDSYISLWLPSLLDATKNYVITILQEINISNSKFIEKFSLKFIPEFEIRTSDANTITARRDDPIICIILIIYKNA